MCQYKNALYELDEQLRVLNNKRYYLSQLAEIEQYHKNKKLIGRYFKDGLTYYKVIDLEIDNQYRCMVLTFKDATLDVDDMYGHRNGWKAIQNIFYLGAAAINVESEMISKIENIEEISEKEYTQAYFKQAQRMLEADKVISAARDNQMIKLSNECLSGLGEKTNEKKDVGETG